MTFWACPKPLSADWPLYPPFPATFWSLFFSFLLFCHRSTKIALRYRCFDDTSPTKKREDVKKKSTSGCLACSKVRSFKATPTAHCINPDLGWKNSLLFFSRAVEDHLSRPGKKKRTRVWGLRARLKPRSVCSLISLMTVIIYWGACCAGGD